MKKIKLLTHNDLDGVGCYIVAETLLSKKYKVDVTYCTHSNIEDMLSETILKLEEYEHIYITDIVVSDDYIHQFFTPEVVKKVTIIDHHKTNLALNQYSFAHICVEKEDTLMCGTYLFYEHLTKFLSKQNSHKKLETFVDAVRSYDTWDWFRKDDKFAKNMNDLLYIKGIKDFTQDILKNLSESHDFLLNESDWFLLKYENLRRENYIKSKEKHLYEYQMDSYHFGVIFAEQYVSELGNEVATSHLELDFVAIVGSKSISLRTVKENIDVSCIAKKFGGGGQQKAAGIPLTSDMQRKYIQLIFDGYVEIL